MGITSEVKLIRSSKGTDSVMFQFDIHLEMLPDFKKSNEELKYFFFAQLPNYIADNLKSDKVENYTIDTLELGTIDGEVRKRDGENKE